MNQDEYPVDEETIHILLNATTLAENQATQSQSPTLVNQDISAPQPRRISTLPTRNRHQDQALQTESTLNSETRKSYERTLRLYEAQLRVHKNQAEHIEYLNGKINFLETNSNNLVQELNRLSQLNTEQQNQIACLSNPQVFSTIFPQPLHHTENLPTMPGQNPAMMNTPQQNKTLRRQRNRHRRKDRVRQIEAHVAESELSPSSQTTVMRIPSPTLHNSPIGEQTIRTNPLDSYPPSSKRYEVSTQNFRQSSSLKGELMSQIVILTYQTLVISLVVILLAYIYAMLR